MQNDHVIYGSQHVTAMRVFRVNKETLTLTSIAGGREEWYPGEIKQSRCKVALGHEDLKPSLNCTCGIWACKNRRELHKLFGFCNDIVSAQVELWGVVIEHEFGYRAEFARIIPESITAYPRREKPRNVRLVRHLRAKYNVAT